MIINNKYFQTDIETIVETLKKELESRGSNLLSKTRHSGDYLMVTCPYHKNGQERNPSAQFRKKDGLFYCFACQKTKSLPDVITYCLKENGLNWLRACFISNAIEERKFTLQFEQEKEDTPYVDKKELEQYRYIHPYITNRGISDEVVIKFDVGYDEKTKCITFPVKDKNGNILFIARRSIKSKYFNYPKDVAKPLYGEYEIRRDLKGKQAKEIYVVEGMIDCLTLWTWGHYAVALNGIGSYKQYLLLKQLPTRLLILATDNDEKGQLAREKIKKYVKNKLIKELVDYGDCKDVNEMTHEQFLNCKVTL